MLIEKGKPSDAGAGCAGGVLLAPLLLFGGGWVLGHVIDLLRAIFG